MLNAKHVPDEGLSLASTTRDLKRVCLQQTLSLYATKLLGPTDHGFPLSESVLEKYFLFDALLHELDDTDILSHVLTRPSISKSKMVLLCPKEYEDLVVYVQNVPDGVASARPGPRTMLVAMAKMDVVSFDSAVLPECIKDDDGVPVRLGWSLSPSDAAPPSLPPAATPTMVANDAATWLFDGKVLTQGQRVQAETYLWETLDLDIMHVTPAEVQHHLEHFAAEWRAGAAASAGDKGKPRARADTKDGAPAAADLDLGRVSHRLPSGSAAAAPAAAAAASPRKDRIHLLHPLSAEGDAEMEMAMVVWCEWVRWILVDPGYLPNIDLGGALYGAVVWKGTPALIVTSIVAHDVFDQDVEDEEGGGHFLRSPNLPHVARVAAQRLLIGLQHDCLLHGKSSSLPGVNNVMITGDKELLEAASNSFLAICQPLMDIVDEKQTQRGGLKFVVLDTSLSAHAMNHAKAWWRIGFALYLIRAASDSGASLSKLLTTRVAWCLEKVKLAADATQSKGPMKGRGARRTDADHINLVLDIWKQVRFNGPWRHGHTRRSEFRQPRLGTGETTSESSEEA